MAEGSNKAQVQAYRFGLRRLENAVASGDSTYVPFGGIRPSMMTIIGLVVAGVLVAGFAVYGFIKPAPSIGDAKVLVDTDNGGSYAVRDGVLYPALNLTSAMLAATDDKGAGADGSVRQVNGEALKGKPKGRTIGIPGAPTQIPKENQLVANTWQLCDATQVDPSAAVGTVVKPRSLIAIGSGLNPDEQYDVALLATTDNQSYWLLWGGSRREVDVNSGLIEALGVTTREARLVSTSLLNSLQELPPLTPPKIPDAGAAAQVGGVSATVGQVFKQERANQVPSFVLVLRDGIQIVPPFFADVVRVTTKQGDFQEIAAADVASASKTKAPLDISGYPVTAPSSVAPETARVLCSGFTVLDGTPIRTLQVANVLPIPKNAEPLTLPPSSTGSQNVPDAVYIAPNHGLVAGDSTDGVNPNPGSLWLINDQGTRYPVVNLNAMKALGLGKTIAPVPSEYLGLLRQGPQLSPEAARLFATDDEVFKASNGG